MARGRPITTPLSTSSISSFLLFFFSLSLPLSSSPKGEFLPFLTFFQPESLQLSTCAARSPSARPWWYVPEQKSRHTESRRLAVTCFRALTCLPAIPATHMACTHRPNLRSVSTRYVPAPALMNQTSINKPWSADHSHVDRICAVDR